MNGPFLALSLVLLLSLAVVSSFLFCRGRSDFDHTGVKGTMKGGKGEGGADEDYTFLFKGERVMENMSVSFHHLQKVVRLHAPRESPQKSCYVL